MLNLLVGRRLTSRFNEAVNFIIYKKNILSHELQTHDNFPKVVGFVTETKTKENWANLSAHRRAHDNFPEVVRLGIGRRTRLNLDVNQGRKLREFLKKL